LETPQVEGPHDAGAAYGRLVHDLGPCAEPDAGTSDPVWFVLSRALGQGRQAAMVSVFGLAVASVIHAVAAAFGLSAMACISPYGADLAAS
jgi:hypothetical protein